MTFNDLVQFYLNEAKGVDPMKFAYKGAPMGFRKSTDIENPETYVPDSPSRKLYSLKGVPVAKRAKGGEYIVRDIMKYIKTSLLVTIADPAEGKKLQEIVKEFSSLYHEYVAATRDVKRLDELIAKKSQSGMRFYQKGGTSREVTGGQGGNTVPASEIDALKEERDAQEQRAGEYKELASKFVDENKDELHNILSAGAKNFVEAIKPLEGGQVFKSLEDLEIVPEEDPGVSATKAFLQDITKGKVSFEPLDKFIANQRETHNRNPFVYLTNLYKSAVDEAVKNHLVGRPEALLNYVSRIVGKIRAMKGSIKEPTKGKVEMKKKDPQLLQVANLIKKGKYQEAKQAVNSTKLDNTAKADLMINIDKLSRGEISEADVIRPLYAI
jgi:hypothetical protein